MKTHQWDDKWVIIDKMVHIPSEAITGDLSRRLGRERPANILSRDGDWLPFPEAVSRKLPLLAFESEEGAQAYIDSH